VGRKALAKADRISQAVDKQMAAEIDREACWRVARHV
jgi:hypothetical protein